MLYARRQRGSQPAGRAGSEKHRATLGGQVWFVEKASADSPGVRQDSEWGSPRQVSRPHAPSGGAGRLMRIHQVAKLLRWFEVGHPFRRHLHALAGLRVASNAGIALANAKRPEATNLNLVATLQCPD